MEHKVSTAMRRCKQKVLEVIHWCGTCRYYTEVYKENGWFRWGEHCNAGKSYEYLRHCSGNCDLWEPMVTA